MVPNQRDEPGHRRATPYSGRDWKPRDAPIVTYHGRQARALADFHAHDHRAGARHAAAQAQVTGVGNAEEQERHATSTLLSTMMAVRDFGRAVVARFGGPAGSIETYLDLPFTLEERTSIPDGVIRVARAGRTWTALSRSRPVPARYGRSRSSATWIWPASSATSR
jgi:hypothetical protein